MNYAIPLYQCQKDENPGRVPHYSCTVEIGGIRYIGAAAKTKKEAEIKAARTALLAIQSSTSEKSIGDTPLTVIPSKKRGLEAKETSNVPKAKKPRFRKTKFKKKLSGVKVFQTRIENVQKLGLNVGNVEESKCETNNASSAFCSIQLPTQLVTNSQDGKAQNEKVKYAVEGGLILHTDGNSAIGLPTTVLDSNGSNNGAVNVGTPMAAMSYGDATLVSKNANEVSGCGEVVLPVNNSSVDQLEAASMVGLNQVE